MPGLRKQETKIGRLVPIDGSNVYRKETLKENSEDESESKITEITDYVTYSCSHTCREGYGFTCSVCGSLYCRDCLPKARYCKECDAPLCIRCMEEMGDGSIFCPECSPLIDWSGPVGKTLEAVITVGVLVLTVCLLWKYLG